MRRVRTAVISFALVIFFSHRAGSLIDDAGLNSPDWVKEALLDLDQAANDLEKSFGKKSEKEEPIKFPPSPVDAVQQLVPPNLTQLKTTPGQKPPSTPGFIGGEMDWKKEVDKTSLIIDECEGSESTKNGRRVNCKEDIILFENFSSVNLNPSLWVMEKFMPEDGFMVLLDKNVEVVDGMLYITPTERHAEEVMGGEINLQPGCTSTTPFECYRKSAFAYINPPVSSGRISTKNSLSFKYGTIEIRAQLPVGDWLVPHIFLKSKYNTYGTGKYESGEIALVKSRGNLFLWDSKENDISNKLVESVVLVRNKARRKEEYNTAEPWGDGFHTYTMKWTPDAIVFSVDNKTIGMDEVQTTKPYHKLMELPSSDAKDFETRLPIAPFDKEFYLDIGIDIAGLNPHDFPDNSLHGEKKKPKPWTVSDVKAVANFWGARNEWRNTWKKGKEKLIIDYIKITAL